MFRMANWPLAASTPNEKGASQGVCQQASELSVAQLPLRSFGVPGACVPLGLQGSPASCPHPRIAWAMPCASGSGIGGLLRKERSGRKTLRHDEPLSVELYTGLPCCAAVVRDTPGCHSSMSSVSRAPTSE